MSDTASFFGIYPTDRMLFSLVKCEGDCATLWALAVIGHQHYAFWNSVSVNGPREYEESGAGVICPQCGAGLKIVVFVAMQNAQGRWLDLSDAKFYGADGTTLSLN